MQTLDAERASTRSNAGCLDLAALEASALQTDPFDHVIVPDIIALRALDAILEAFPAVPGPGSHAPASLRLGAPFAALLRELEGDAFRHEIGRKFAIDLAGRPTVTTIRGALRKGDGAVHTDSRSKLITVLLYLNRQWTEPGGRLRVLRSPHIDDVAVEILPRAGTLLAFRRGEKSWHGHAPFVGRRAAVQMSYVIDAATALREERRHRLATGLKRVVRRVLPARVS